jgi:hypothetical protein
MRQRAAHGRLTARFALCVLVSLCRCLPVAAQTAAAASPPSPPQIKIGTTIFADATQVLEPSVRDTADHLYRPNAFNVTRAYVNVTGAFNPVFAFRVTSDIAREQSASDSLDGSYLVRLKYAYAQFTLDKWTGRFTETWVRFGLTPTPFVEGRDSIYRYRWQGPLMPESERLISSSDVGLSVHTAFPGGYGDAQVSLINGEGYQHPEVNNQKALQGRVTVRPMAHADSEFLKALRLTVFYDDDHYMHDADRQRGFYGVTYENHHANLGAEIVRSRDEVTPRTPVVKGTGWDVFATPFFKEKGHGPEALIRYDHWTPDSARPDLKERLVLGLSYWWTPAGSTGLSAAVMLDYESVTVSRALLPPPDQRRLTLHTVLTF